MFFLDQQVSQMNKFKKITLTLGMLVANNANALMLDTMLLIGDKYGNGVFSLTNNTGMTEYVESSIIEVTVDNEGNLERKDYTKENFIDWNITLTHPKLILEKERTKQVGVRSLCGSMCTFKDDQYYLINFSPSPYNDSSEQTSAVSVNFGYRPLFVIPAELSEIKFDIKYENNKLKIKNDSNTFLRFYIDHCSKEIKDNCESTIISLSGRERSYSLPENIDVNNMKFTVVNHDESYKEEVVVERNEP